MRFLVFTLRGSAPSLALAAAFPLHAQTAALPQVMVTATRSPTPAAALVSEATVIDWHAIEDLTARTLPELLARTAGVQIWSSGGLGVWAAEGQRRRKLRFQGSLTPWGHRKNRS